MDAVIDKLGPYTPVIAFIGGFVVLGAVLLQSMYARVEAQRLQERSDELIKLQQEVLNYQTGGDGFPVVSIRTPSVGDAEVKVFVENFVSEYPLPDIRVWVTDVTDAPPLSKILESTPPEKQAAAIDAAYGKVLWFGPESMAVREARPVGSFSIDPEKEHLRYNITALGRNERRWTQLLSYRLFDGEWRTASRVYDEFHTVLHESVGKKYPRGADGEPLW